MPENEPNPEVVSMLEKTLKKYKIFFFSAVGLLVIAVVLFTNYDAGSRLTGYIGQTPFEQDPQNHCKQYPNDPLCKTIPPPPKTEGQTQGTACTEGQKTSDSTLICKSGKWEVNAVPPEDESIPSLTPKSGQTMTASKDAPSEDESVPSLTPKSGQATPDDESVPSLTPIKKQADGQTSGDTETTDLKITKAAISSKTFNPLVNSTKFTVTVSADAKIDIKIYDKAGKLVSSALSNKDAKGDKEYEIYWEGNDESKTTLPAGTYSYKIIAKDPTTKKDADTKTGEVILKYGSTAKDFENINGKTSGSNSVNPADTTKSVTDQSVAAQNAQSSSNDKATVALQNSKEGKTAGTGPETIIYLIFPILGYTISRKFK